MKLLLSREDILQHLDEFSRLYESRVIKNNDGGMKSAHMFAMWCIVKHLQPSHIIESGVWKGLGTWFMEKACPTSKITSIDPVLNSRSYISNNVTYTTNDFKTLNWDSVDKENTLCFFDDHQNAFDRIEQCKSIGFKHLMFEDNYPPNQGDCYSPKKILSGSKWVIDVAGNRTWCEPVEEHRQILQECCKYYEFPPIFKSESTRWGDAWDATYPTPEPLLKASDSDKYATFWSEKKDYTWICYIVLNES
jgi:hypothetical protein